MRRAAASRFIGAVIAILAAVAAIAWLGGYRINFTPSYPLGLWRIKAIGRLKLPLGRAAPRFQGRGRGH